MKEKDVLLSSLWGSSLLFCILWSSSSLIGQQFVQSQVEAGINHVYVQRQFTGGGCAFVDINNDNYDDIYITGGANPDQLYLNNQDGTFEDVSFSSRVVLTGNYYTTGVNAGDMDNDGYIDLFVATTISEVGGLGKNLLLHNQGDNTFREVWPFDDDLHNARSINALFLDFDLDGDLDIYVYNYVDEIRLIKDTEGNTIDFDHRCYPNKMYENLGNLQFEDVTEKLGLLEAGCALAALATDIDQDGDIDIYLGNDFGLQVEPNRLFRNDFKETGTFTEISQSIGLRQDIYCMGFASGDIDGDLDMDIYMTNNGRNVLLRQDEGLFRDHTATAGVENTWNRQDSTLAVGWGTFLADLDNDRDLDLYVANGYTPSSLLLPTEFIDRDRLYINDGSGLFAEEEHISAGGNPFVARGTAYSDYDRDGDLDFMTVVYDRPANLGVPKTILYNNIGNENHWLQVHLEGLVCNKDAYGAKVYLYSSTVRMIHEVEGGSSHCSKNSSVVHFGLGDLSHVDSLEILWPGSPVPQRVYDIPINTRLSIVQDENYREISTATETISPSSYKIFPNPGDSDILLTWQEDNEVTFSLYTQNGSMILHRRFRGKGTFTINVSDIPVGYYTIRLTRDHRTINTPWVKVRK